MVLSYPEFFVIYACSLALATVIGLLLLVGWDNLWLRRMLHSAKENWVYLVILSAMPLLIELQGALGGGHVLPNEQSLEVRYTGWMYDLGGGSIKVLQSWTNYGLVTDIFIVVYAWLFYFLLYFAPVLLIARGDSVTLRRYSVAFVVTYVILASFYAFFPVSVSPSYPGAGVVPILYVNSYWGRMVTSIDPLNNDFPSGHISLTMTAFLIFATAGPSYRRFAVFLGGVTATTAIAVLSLGIHWPADVVAGFLVGVFAVVFASNEKVQKVTGRWVERLTKRVRGTREGEPSPR